MREPLTLTGAGDAALTRRFADLADSELQGLIDDADASLVNLEAPVLDDKSMPAAFNNGLYLRSPSWSLDELTDFGFNMFAAASNHSGDYLQQGMRSTMDALDARNLCYAGLGEHIKDARAPGYVETPAGRIALVSACASVKRGIQAGPAHRNQESRPGIAPLRTRTAYRITDEQFAFLREMSEDIGLEDLKRKLGVPEGTDDSMLLMDVDSGTSLPFVRADEAGVNRQLVPSDVKPVLNQITQARKRADHVIVSVHAHQGAEASFNNHTVPEFLESFAHDCVKLGADGVMCHGPHVLRGIEVFQDAPIFYSLGNFALQFETTDLFPAEMYGKHGVDDDAPPVELVEEVSGDVMVDMRKTRMSVVPVVEYGEELEITLYPIDMGVGERQHRRGNPELAGPEIAEEVLTDLQAFSEPFGTEIVRDDGVGYVEL